MPLRDHFRPPLSNERSWDELNGGWPMTIATALNRRMPRGFIAVPQVHLGTLAEVDMAAWEKPTTDARKPRPAFEPWSPQPATVLFETRSAEPDEYEVHVHDRRRGRTLVAAVEIVSPSNKAKPAGRRKFLSKCEGLLRSGVSVTIVDLVTNRKANLYRLLLRNLRKKPVGSATISPICAVTLRSSARDEKRMMIEAWAEPLAVGQVLPTLPLWLTATTALPLELDKMTRMVSPRIGGWMRWRNRRRRLPHPQRLRPRNPRRPTPSLPGAIARSSSRTSSAKSTLPPR